MTFAFPRRGRTLAAGQRSELTVIDLQGNKEVLLTVNAAIEAPNWSPDGKWLVFNAGGCIYRMPTDASAGPEQIDAGRLIDLNNDHVISPDGSTIYVSSDDGHIYAVPFSGGAPRRVSNEHSTPFHYYLHGISPDGRTLSYVAVEKKGPERRVNVFTIPSAGGPDLQLTHMSVPNDGPEYSPDGRWIYFNSELAASQPGHAQIFRMHSGDGSGLEQLTFDACVNWFPHVSPDGQHVVFLSYPAGTIGHPADKEVKLRLMTPDGDDQRELVSFFGGQGTINVNSWAPDSARLAYVAYPLST
ncbi:TolB family protein [Devosia sp. RR2S18]|uniref:TolB family protein n=1 Tax=Devosia rhizosphaerae TaxID=3049774 RepID=UPI00253F7D84|nr:biopolymer transporter Tol [Devosia sp. RR2S18]WIJ26492.1 biopolymer transporter Tol [Devosia sp. RR2S18]